MRNTFINHSEDVVESLIWELEKEMLTLHMYS